MVVLWLLRVLLKQWVFSNHAGWRQYFTHKHEGDILLVIYLWTL